MNKCIAILLFSAACLIAQDGNDKVSVPLKDPSRPARVNANMMVGAITVRGADVKEVSVESQGHGRVHREAEVRPDGLRRLDIPGGMGVDLVEDNNTVRIKTNSFVGSGNVVITVPRRSDLQLKSMSGEISVEGVEGEIDANTMSGKVTVKNVSGSVIAHSLNGAISVSLDRVDPSKPMSFSTMNGAIDVTLPDNVKANLGIKVDNGEVWTDFDVKMSASQSTVRDRDHDRDRDTDTDRAFRGHAVRLDHTFHGTINGGGAEFQFTTYNGQITIRKKK